MKDNGGGVEILRDVVQGILDVDDSGRVDVLGSSYLAVKELIADGLGITDGRADRLADG